MHEFYAWFDWRPSLARRLFAFLLLVFAAGTYMYVQCELFTPRWYGGRFAGRFGLLPSNSELLTFR